MPADLLIGGTLGGWALGHVDPADVAQVVTDDPTLARAAGTRGLPVRTTYDYAPSARGLSVHYQRILPATVIGRYAGLWNLHPGLLPWGRGMYPVFWALWEGSPAGATLHELVEALDSGAIVEQIEVRVRSRDTGGSLHRRVQAAEKALFDAYWPRIVAGEALTATPQPDSPGSFHTRAEFHALKDGGAPGRAADLDRCLTFP